MLNLSIIFALEIGEAGVSLTGEVGERGGGSHAHGVIIKFRIVPCRNQRAYPLLFMNLPPALTMYL